MMLLIPVLRDARVAARSVSEGIFLEFADSLAEARSSVLLAITLLMFRRANWSFRSPAKVAFIVRRPGDREKKVYQPGREREPQTEGLFHFIAVIVRHNFLSFSSNLAKSTGSPGPSKPSNPHRNFSGRRWRWFVRYCCFRLKPKFQLNCWNFSRVVTSSCKMRFPNRKRDYREHLIFFSGMFPECSEWRNTCELRNSGQSVESTFASLPVTTLPERH